MWAMISGMVIFLILAWIIYAHFSSSGPSNSTAGSGSSTSQSANLQSLPVASTSTILSYDIEVPSEKQSDGKYQTQFEIFLYYPQGTQPKTMSISQLIDCPPISSSNNLTYSQNPNGIHFSLLCTSGLPIIKDDGNLFVIPKTISTVN